MQKVSSKNPKRFLGGACLGAVVVCALLAARAVILAPPARGPSTSCAPAYLRSLAASAAAASAVSASASNQGPPISDALAGRWVNVADLLNHRNASALPPRSGACPPAPARCALQDVFDEVFLISLPRFAERAERTVRQLDALGVPFTLVHAQDARSGSVAAFLSLFWPGDTSLSSRGTIALLATHLDILSYVAQTPQLERVLILEDDVFFHADFPSQFDLAARNVPTDWRVFWVGAMAVAGVSKESPPGGGVARVSGGIDRIYGAFAVGLHREAAAVVYDSIVKSRSSIDYSPYDALTKRWPQQEYLLWPTLVVTTQWTGSTIGHSTVNSVAKWMRETGTDQTTFDFARGYFVGGEAGLEAVCPELHKGLAFEGARPYAVSSARSSEECCAECARQLPRCASIVFEEAAFNVYEAAVRVKGARKTDFKVRYLDSAGVGGELPAFEAGENCALMQGSPGELRAAEPSRKDKLASARVVQVPRAAAAA